jgi:hypothetical protein
MRAWIDILRERHPGVEWVPAREHKANPRPGRETDHATVKPGRPYASRPMELIYGAGKLERRVPNVETLLRGWRDKERDFGQLYLEHEPITPPDRVFVEDLAVTMLMNSRVDARQAMGVSRNGGSLDLSALPAKPLEETTDSERQTIAELISSMTGWPGVGASVATKTLHKKRPALIPVLDQAGSGA